MLPRRVQDTTRKQFGQVGNVINLSNKTFTRQNKYQFNKEVND